MSCFFDLPNELILKVLRYTETMDILRCGQVSKRIRTISNDNSLFQIVNLSGKFVTTDILEMVLNKGCKSLNLSDSYIFGYFLSLNQNLQLRELDLPNCKSTSSEVLEDLLASCHSLQRLSLEGVELTPKMVACIFQNRQTCTTNLKNIDSKKLSKPDIMLLWNIFDFRCLKT